MKFTDQGLDLIKRFEGCKLTAYKDQGGIDTVGFGCTHHVTPGMTITQEEADERLKEDIQVTVRLVENLIKPHDLNDNQFSSCVCLAFNIGSGNFSKSTLLNCIRMGNLSDAAQEFVKWTKVNGVPTEGLLKRREAERDLFLTET